jgi:hypothetical protein
MQKGTTMDIQMEINAAETSLEAFDPAALEARLSALEARVEALAALCVSATATHAPVHVTNTRKTLPTAMTTLLAKQGVTVDTVEAGALDQALTPLSVEQRIAVKAQLLRSGLLS